MSLFFCSESEKQYWILVLSFRPPKLRVQYFDSNYINALFINEYQLSLFLFVLAQSMEIQLNNSFNSLEHFSYELIFCKQIKTKLNINWFSKKSKIQIIISFSHYLWIHFTIRLVIRFTKGSDFLVFLLLCFHSIHSMFCMFSCF